MISRSDPLKQALADEIQEVVRHAVDVGHLSSVEDMLDEVVPITYKRVTELVGVISIGQGPGKRPRVFDVIVKERK